jgi:hypothetical protein
MRGGVTAAADYLQCRKAGMSPLETGEVADQDLYPEPEESEEEGDYLEG